MNLTQKLIGYLNRVFDKDPEQQLALRLNYDGEMQWQVADGRLTTTVTGGSGAPLSISLDDYTIATLCALLGTQPGYSVAYQVDGDLAQRSALTLMDGAGDPVLSNGDHLASYTSLLWAWLEAAASELKIASDQIVQMLRQMVIGTAEAEWLDELGSYYDVTRLAGETDAVYSARIIASVGRPRGNNVALEMAINTITGGLAAKVTDAPAQAFTQPYAGTSYGLFDVVYSVAFDGSENLGVYTQRVQTIVEAFRDAGTHMRTIAIKGTLADEWPIELIEESMSPLNIALAAFEESAAMGFARHDGTYRRNGSLVADGTPGPLVTFGQGGEALSIRLTVNGVLQPPEAV